MANMSFTEYCDWFYKPRLFWLKMKEIHGNKPNIYAGTSIQLPAQYTQK